MKKVISTYIDQKTASKIEAKARRKGWTVSKVVKADLAKLYAPRVKVA